MNKSRYRFALKLLGHLFVALSFFYLGKIVFDNRAAFGDFTYSPLLPAYLLFFILMYLFGGMVQSYGWWLQLREKYPRFGFAASFSILGISQMGKYLPGNVAHYIARVALLPGYIEKRDASLTLFVESAVLAVMAVFVGMFQVVYLDIGAYFGELKLILLVLGCLGFVVASMLGMSLLRHRFGVMRVRARTLALLALLMLASFALGGVNIYLLFALPGEQDGVTVFQCITGYSLAFVAGFLMPGAPGGLGVREFVFVLLFSPYVPEEIALQVILAFRLICVVGDAVYYLAAWLVGRYRRSRPDTAGIG